MSDYEHPVYITDAEAEQLFGLLAADSATEDGNELHQDWAALLSQLERILFNY